MALVQQQVYREQQQRDGRGGGLLQRLRLRAGQRRWAARCGGGGGDGGGGCCSRRWLSSTPAGDRCSHGVRTSTRTPSLPIEPLPFASPRGLVCLWNGLKSVDKSAADSNIRQEGRAVSNKPAGSTHLCHPVRRRAVLGHGMFAPAVARLPPPCTFQAALRRCICRSTHYRQSTGAQLRGHRGHGKTERAGRQAPRASGASCVQKKAT